jgi:hypothetical protein
MLTCFKTPKLMIFPIMELGDMNRQILQLIHFIKYYNIDAS